MNSQPKKGVEIQFDNVPRHVKSNENVCQNVYGNGDELLLKEWELLDEFIYEYALFFFTRISIISFFSLDSLITSVVLLESCESFFYSYSYWGIIRIISYIQ